MSDFQITVVPRSSRPGITEMGPAELRVRLTSAPVDGKANAELIDRLAEYFKTAKTNITIIRGQRGKRKVVRIA